MFYSRGGRGFTKPPAGAQIDWTHPLSRGLVVDIPFNDVMAAAIVATLDQGLAGKKSGQSALDLVTGRAAVFQTGQAASGAFPSWLAPGVNLFGTNGGVIVESGTTLSDIPFLGPLTVICKAFSATGTQTHYFGGKHTGNGTATNPFDLSTDSSASPLLLLERSNASRQFWFGPAMVINTNSIYISAQDGDLSHNASFWVNGVKSTGTPGLGTTGSPTGNSADLRIGSRADTGAVLFNGVIELFRVYSRVISDEEARWISREPYAHMLVVPYRRWFFISIALQINVADSVTCTEHSTINVYEISLSEAVAVTESVDLKPVLAIVLDEPVVVTEHSQINLYTLEVSESVTVNETTALSRLLIIDEAESVTTTEFTTLQPNLIISINDTATLTELTGMFLGLYFMDSSSVVVTETTTLLIPVLFISKTENVTVVDHIADILFPLLFVSVTDHSTVQDILDPTLTPGHTTVVIAGSPVVITSPLIVAPDNNLANGRYIITVSVKSVTNKCRSSRGFTFQPMYVDVTAGVLGPISLVPSTCLSPNQPYIVKFYSRGPEGNVFRTLTKATVPNVGGPIDFSELFQ